MNTVRTRGTRAQTLAQCRVLQDGCGQRPCSWIGLHLCYEEWDTVRVWRLKRDLHLNPNPPLSASLRHSKYRWGYSICIHDLSGWSKLIWFSCCSLGKQRPVLSHVGEKSFDGLQSPSCNEENSGTATPDPEEGAASSGFVAVNLSPVPQEGDSQEWVMLELEQGSGSGATKPPGQEKPGTQSSAKSENQPSDQQDSQSAAVPSSPVLSQMAMPGTWLLGHRRLPGMLGQLPSVIMGRSQMDQVGMTKQFLVYKQKAVQSN